MPASNGNGASVRFNFENGKGRIDVTIESPAHRTASFELADHAWHNALAFLGQLDTAAAALQQSGAALNRIPHSEVLNRIRVARDYALKLPMANGRLGATGFCMGGGLAWESAAEIEGLNAAVVFYGGPPAEPVMARIKAPVIAFFKRYLMTPGATASR